MAKKPESTSSGNGKRKNKKKSKSGPEAVAMKLKQAKPNPFESIWSRRKFDILGKKRKGEERRIGLSRSIAIEKRKKTLLKEYEQSSKASVFLDKRIGEQNENLGEFDKAIMRSQRERKMKLTKKSKYNLSDGEEDELDIEGVSSFPERDDFEEDVSLDEGEDDYNNKNMTGAGDRSAILKSIDNDENGLGMSFPEGEEKRQKSKKEVMEEIISKSKFFKAQKAKEKEENEQFVEELDTNFTSLVQSEALLSLTQPDKMNALIALVNQKISTDNERKKDASVEKPDSYDEIFSEVAMDMRARPSDRTKTPEEIAQEEKQRLEQLEEERQKRMLTTEDSSDEDGDVSKEDDVSTKRQRIITSGDDLGDSFSHDEESKSRLGWIQQILERGNVGDLQTEDNESSSDSESAEDDDDDEGATDEDDEGCERSPTIKDWEQSDDDGLAIDEEEEEDEDITSCKELEASGDKISHKLDKRKSNSLEVLDSNKSVKMAMAQQRDLPYTIDAPKTLDELTFLLENRSDDEIIEAIKRIRAFNAIKVAAENRKKMQVFYGVLLQYFAVCANTRPLNLKLLNLLVKPFIEMSMEIPYFAAICARQRLHRTRTQFCDDVKKSGRSRWPSLKTICLLRLWSMIFPCSDFRHVVMTPAMLLMCEYIMRCSIITGRDILIGSFLCSMVFSITKQSKKFCPEAIVFLRTLLLSALERKSSLLQDSQLYHLVELKARGSLLCIGGSVSEISPLNVLTVMGLPDDASFFCSDNFRASMLMIVIDTLEGFINIYAEFKSFPELFVPISKLSLELAAQKHMPVAIQDKLKNLGESIENKVHEHHMLRRPLQMRKQKPVPIKLLNPKFEEDFVKGRDYDPDRERAERKKLKKLLKREAKGAARELRKDNYFLFEVKEKEKALVEEERAEKFGKALAFLQEQEHAFKSGQLGKGSKSRKRRR